ncbi:MAG: hypothetical protein NUV49_03255 [Patescibacteria group bacterium]|nr:hypothetical protein [Patescibacteria group bacterium]
MYTRIPLKISWIHLFSTMYSTAIMKKTLVVIFSILILALLSIIGTIVYIKLFSPIDKFL